MVLYPVIAELAHALLNLVAAKESWFRKIKSDQSWKEAAPLKGKVIWMHAASLGEFEMGRPVLEEFLLAHPDWSAVTTFFSPSGYEPRKAYPRARVYYLPFDAPTEVSKWLDYCNPSLALFIRYDLWPNHINALKKRNIPTSVLAMSANSRPWFLHYSLPLIRKVFTTGISLWGVVEQTDAAVLSAAGVHSSVLGNPKFDYATGLVDQNPPPAFQRWKDVQRKPVLLVGSAHKSDLEFLCEADLHEYCIWVVPHKPSELVDLSPYFDKELEVAVDSEAPRSTDLLLVQSFGVLRSLYSLADHIFVGGGFGKAVHNVLEVIAAGKAASSGPHTEKLPENKFLIQKGLLFPCSNKEELVPYLNRDLSLEKEKAFNLLKAHSGVIANMLEALEQTVKF